MSVFFFSVRQTYCETEKKKKKKERKKERERGKREKRTFIIKG
jgi:hypothetical protein